MRGGATDAELLELIRGTWRGRTIATASFARSIAADRESPAAEKKIEMYYIGG